jgi:hypothetical protein
MRWLIQGAVCLACFALWDIVKLPRGESYFTFLEAYRISIVAFASQGIVYPWFA